jgi:DNA anti-recombination protein RmuC
MHAVLVFVTVDPTVDPERRGLHDIVIPQVSSRPGFVAGYWTQPAPGKGVSMTVFEDEQSARAAADALQTMGSPIPAVTIDKVEVAEVVGHAERSLPDAAAGVVKAAEQRAAELLREAEREAARTISAAKKSVRAAPKKVARKAKAVEKRASKATKRVEKRASKATRGVGKRVSKATRGVEKRAAKVTRKVQKRASKAVKKAKKAPSRRR